MSEFIDQYRRAYSTLGRSLKRRDAMPEKEIRAAEKRLCIRIPKALRDYYRIAGRARDFHSVHDRLLPPNDWSVKKGKLIFMEENQAVVLYGTAAGLEPDDDPAAFMCANEDPIRWYKVNPKCSTFLLVMLHWEIAFGGGLPYGGTATVEAALKRTLNRTWHLVGEVNRMRAYQKNGVAVCFLKWDANWIVFIASADLESWTKAASELNLKVSVF